MFIVTETIMNIDKVAKKVVKYILEELDNRGGFDDWWDSVDEETQEDIRNELLMVVAKVLKAA